MKALDTWFCMNKLSLNAKKSNFMLFGTPTQLKSYGGIRVYHRQHQLEQCSTFKYLGIVLDLNLSFRAHVEHMK